MEQIWERRVRQRKQRRAVARVAAAVILLTAAGMAWAIIAYALIHLPETVGHAAGTMVRAYNESAH